MSENDSTNPGNTDPREVSIDNAPGQNTQPTEILPTEVIQESTNTQDSPGVQGSTPPQAPPAEDASTVGDASAQQVAASEESAASQNSAASQSTEAVPAGSAQTGSALPQQTGFPAAPAYYQAPDGSYFPAAFPAGTFPAGDQNVHGNQGYYPFPAGAPYSPPVKKKHSWSTAALVAATLAGLLFGGLVGGLAGMEIGRNSRPYSQEYSSPQTSQPQLPDFGSQDWQNQDNSALEKGERVTDIPGVVLISSVLYHGEGAGTGIVVDKSGIVLTNYHVVEGSTTVTITTADLSTTYEATVVGHNQEKDVAVLQITDVPKGLETASIAKKAAKLGDSVSAVGNGSGQGYLTKLEGKVTAVNQSITAAASANSEESNKLTGLIKTDADVVSGYSGGPLLNEKGEVVGINTAASRGQTSEQVDGYAIPIARVMEVAEEIKAGKSTDGNIIGKNAALGVSVKTVTGEGSDGSQVVGAQVAEVVKGSGAEAAGIVPGETILKLDGEAIKNSADLSKQIKKHKIGDTVTLSVIGTDGSTARDVQVTLGEASVN